MSRLIILEGARCTGKTQSALWLRQTGINYSTLINFTGFPHKGVRGLGDAFDYYRAWMKFFEQVQGREMTFIADRFFFSEMVFSTLYKDYDFKCFYDRFCVELVKYVDLIDIFYLMVNKDALAERVKRENKVDFAGVGDDVEEIQRQQLQYAILFNRFSDTYSGDKIKLHRIDTSDLSQTQVTTRIYKQLIEGGVQNGIAY